MAGTLCVIGGKVPARFDTLCASLRGGQKKPQRGLARALSGAGFSGKMHPAHLRQPWRAGQIGNGKGHRTRAQTFFHAPKNIFRALGMHQDQARGVNQLCNP